MAKFYLNNISLILQAIFFPYHLNNQFPVFYIVSLAATHLSTLAFNSYMLLETKTSNVSLKIILIFSKNFVNCCFIALLEIMVLF